MNTLKYIWWAGISSLRGERQVESLKDTFEEAQRPRLGQQSDLCDLLVISHFRMSAVHVCYCWQRILSISSNLFTIPCLYPNGSCSHSILREEIIWIKLSVETCKQQLLRSKSCLHVSRYWFLFFSFFICSSISVTCEVLKGLHDKEERLSELKLHLTSILFHVN